MKTILLLIVVKQDYELTPINRHAGMKIKFHYVFNRLYSILEAVMVFEIFYFFLATAFLAAGFLARHFLSRRFFGCNFLAGFLAIISCTFFNVNFVASTSLLNSILILP
jgi:hypothetical protein